MIFLCRTKVTPDENRDLRSVLHFAKYVVTKSALVVIAKLCASAHFALTNGALRSIGVFTPKKHQCLITHSILLFFWCS